MFKNLTALAILAVCIVLNPVLKAESCPEVILGQGLLRGEYKTSRGGKTFASFTKIPYAKPPIGELRFKAPVSADPWTGVYDATQKVPKCIQKDYVSYNKPEIEGVEDCLFLNVYVPEDNQVHQKEKLLPVMVFLHYGGTISGSSQAERLGPEYFMDRKVLLVTFNYRLGIFGYFSTLNDDSPGNYGFKDQVLALKWIQDNIEHFGGDRNQVTIFGQSAGAGAVHHLMLSPSSQGLFQRAISESGSAMCLWAKPLDMLQEVIYPATGQILGCDPSNTTALVECMRKLDAETVISSDVHLKTFHRDPFVIYTAVLEKRSEKNPEPFLERDPSEIILSGNFQKVPWIVGTVENEGDLKSGPVFIDKIIREEYIQRFDELGVGDMLLAASMQPENIPEFWGKVKEFYFKNNSFEMNLDDAIDSFTNMYGDRWFSYGTYQAALLHALQGHQNIWFYNFNFTGSVTFANSVFVRDTEDTLDHNYGVSHCDDLLYLFKSPELFPDYELTPTELQMSRIMINLWTTFATTGNPHKDWQPLPAITESPATNKNLHYLDIRGPKDLVLRNDYRRSRMQFWTDSGIFENVAGIV